MIPLLPSPLRTIQEDYARALASLREHGFAGDLSLDPGDRTVLSTDNSIYQVAPQAVAYPRTVSDLVQIAALLADPRFRHVVVQPRGGGTGTNGQSLGEGLSVDLSRHMNRLIELNPVEGWVRVEPGVVKDQLNRYLADYGLFFAPELSTSDRATIGGMISTDASGQGSCLYGKTRDHVLALTVVLDGGVVWTSTPLDEDELRAARARDDVVGRVHRVVDDVQRENTTQIAQWFPPLNRCLTGYDLAHIRDARGGFDLNSVLCGSEGTLAFIAEAKLRVLPIPGSSAIFIVRYGSFDEALRDSRALISLNAASIETIDSKVLSLARDDSVWSVVAQFFPDEEELVPLGVNFVEFVGSRDQVASRVDEVSAALAKMNNLGFTIARGDDTKKIWAMRKRAVGLLGNLQGDRRPIPFVEDTAVPPERLADYIREFRDCLDRRGLEYGMFGHVDAGVLHVRPALDMKDPAQELLVREVTEEVVALTKKYGGLLWGEHGKGFRSEFVPRTFGPLTPALTRIKAAFDPRDQLNPGKIASAADSPLTPIDGVQLRGHLDRSISESTRSAFDEALHCNGNGACFNYDVDDAMCPSWKGTRERRHSPKGRSALVREWLRLLERHGNDPVAEGRAVRGRGWLSSIVSRLRNGAASQDRASDFSHVVKEAMDGCLGCKACAGTCPIKVDVPTFRAKFLELYHFRYSRPWRDYLVGLLETILPIAAKMPRFSNRIMRSAVFTGLMEKVGLSGVPALSGKDLADELSAHGITIASSARLERLSETDRARSVILVQDAFTSYFDTEVVIDIAVLLKKLGFNVYAAPFRPNGKPLHVQGMLGRFERVAQKNVALLRQLGATGIKLVGIDPSMTLTYRDEYKKSLGEEQPVLLLQEWLAENLSGKAIPQSGARMRLLPHCTEKSMVSGSASLWRRVFNHFGVELDIVAVGCCGMAGTYGHELEHLDMSRRIFDLSWASALTCATAAGQLTATGYSCRCQAERVGMLKIPHPAQALLAHLYAADRLDPLSGH